MGAALKKLLKDLLYTGGNEALDIARLSSLIAVIAYWTGVFVHMGNGGGFDPVAVGGGWTAIAAGGGGWIYARQTKEAPAAETITTSAKVEKIERRAAPDAEMT